MGVKRDLGQLFNIKIICSIFFILIILTHCAARQEVIIKEDKRIVQIDERELLRKRVNDYWQYHINAKVDVEKAYLSEHPGFREKVPLMEYLDQYRMTKHLEVNVLSVEVEGERGKALVELKYTMYLTQLPKKDWTKKEEDQWIKIKNEWYHIPKGFELAKK